MDVGLTNSIVSTSTALASRQTSDAINITVLKKALDVQASAAATLLQALPSPPWPHRARWAPRSTHLHKPTGFLPAPTSPR